MLCGSFSGFLGRPFKILILFRMPSRKNSNRSRNSRRKQRGGQQTTTRGGLLTTTSTSNLQPISPASAVSLYKQALAYVSNFNESQLNSEINTINQRVMSSGAQQQLFWTTRGNIDRSNPPTQPPDRLTMMRHHLAVMVAASSYVFGLPVLAQSTTTSGNATTTVLDVKTLLPQVLTKALTMSPDAINSEMRALSSLYSRATPAQMAKMGPALNQIAPFMNYTQSKIINNIVFGTPI